MSAEIDCITSCVVLPPNPLQAAANILLMGIILFSLVFLFFFPRLISTRQLLFLKSLSLLSILGLLVNWWLIQPAFGTFFASIHNGILLLIIAFFFLSFFLARPIIQMGLLLIEPSARQLHAFDQIMKQNDLTAIRLILFNEKRKIAFAVDGLQKSVFVSTGVLESFSKGEVSLILRHELLHFKTPFLGFKRLLHSIRAGFFGMIPVSLDDFDDYEEEKLDQLLEKKGIPIRLVRKKMD